MQFVVARPKIFAVLGAVVFSLVLPLYGSPTVAKDTVRKSDASASKAPAAATVKKVATDKAKKPAVNQQIKTVTAAVPKKSEVVQDRIVADPACGTTVLWHNLNSCATGVNTDVVDQNIDVSGTNQIVGPIHVIANTCNVLVTVNSGDAVITGCNLTQPRLYLWANTDQTITFSLENSLTFQGTNNGSTLIDLLVSISGPGTVIFDVFGGEKVSFTGAHGTGGVKLFMDMSADNPKLLFKRDGVVADDAEIKVGPNSIMGYVSPVQSPATGPLANITFDAANTGTGRLVLHVSPKGNVLISPRWLTTGSFNDYLISDVDPEVLGGGTASFDVINSLPDFPASLVVVNRNDVVTTYMNNPFCDNAFITAGGMQYGFILGSNGVIDITDRTYFDYIGTRFNHCPKACCKLPEALTELGFDEDSITKPRNASAFIADATPGAPSPLIIMTGNSGLYFRSELFDFDHLSTFSHHDFDHDRGPSAGNVVLDVEGALDIQGADKHLEGIRVLSLQVTPTGGFAVVREGLPYFPARTFATDKHGHLLRYDKAYFLINGRLNLNGVSLVHDDENHEVLEKNDTTSEPTYVGGEHHFLTEIGICPRTDCSRDTAFEGRPKISFVNAPFHLLSDVAFTGVDILVPNNPCGGLGCPGNNQPFIFYTNGRAVDNGVGRQMVLGTDVGSFACDGKLIDRNAHFDVIQELPDPRPGTHHVHLRTAASDSSINDEINPLIPPHELRRQASVHTIYLGHASNISLGVQDTVGTTSDCSGTFLLTTTPTLTIDGCYFSFDTRGGDISYPEESGVTGEGAIFVDTNGLFDVKPYRRANISTMVVKSHNGRVDLPASQIFFNLRVGITNWQLNLTDPSQLDIVPAGSLITDYTLDWIATKKNYAVPCVRNGRPFIPLCGWMPYEFCNAFPCEYPPVSDNNLISLPEVHGEVYQFQIKRSRIGDMAHLKVGDGGYVRELVFLSGYDSAEAPTGVVVVEDGGRVGLGSASRNVDSVDAAVVLGANGVTIIPNNGGGIIEVNDSLIINNVCQIAAGPEFGLANTDTLVFRSEIEKEIRVRNGGVLDLSSMTKPSQVVEFTGQLKLVLEVGSTVRLGGGLLLFSEDSGIIVQTSDPMSVPTSADQVVRARFIGTGEVRFTDASQMFVHENAVVGIETMAECDVSTNLLFHVQDGARIAVGDFSTPGGAFQVGDTVPSEDRSVTFSLELDGVSANFVTQYRGFFGLGVGVVSKPAGAPANQWTVSSLFNVNSITINIAMGAFSYNSIVDGNDLRSTLFAIGGNADGKFSFVFDSVDALIRGGGNLVKLDPTITDASITVTDFNGTIAVPGGLARVGIMSSAAMLLDNATIKMFGSSQINVSADQLFTYLALRDEPFPSYSFPRVPFAKSTIDTNILVYENDATIFRKIVTGATGPGGIPVVDFTHSLDIGSISLLLNSNNSIASINVSI